MANIVSTYPITVIHNASSTKFKDVRIRTDNIDIYLYITFDNGRDIKTNPCDVVIYCSNKSFKDKDINIPTFYIDQYSCRTRCIYKPVMFLPSD